MGTQKNANVYVEGKTELAKHYFANHNEIIKARIEIIKARIIN